jgi:hypothetical protein
MSLKERDRHVAKDMATIPAFREITAKFAGFL